jgi:pSer/pThr/pTyr-binding forkhead associated (FHA) protein
MVEPLSSKSRPYTMPAITLQVLEGLERGRFYHDLVPPVSIGREDENTIRLNDERVSRFHAKLQEDAGRIILTDLDSTNGTRVNGRPVQMRVLKPGDQVAIGRCLLLFGSPDEIFARAERGKAEAAAANDLVIGEEYAEDGSFRLSGRLPEMAPDLPQDLTPGQRAQLADVLGHIHDEIRRTLLASEEVPTAGSGTSLTDMRVPGKGWQRLLRLEMDLAVALRRIADPTADMGSSPGFDEETG